ncbi:hypothetical protein D3C72_2421910 [compost metagenome]
MPLHLEIALELIPASCIQGVVVDRESLFHLLLHLFFQELAPFSLIHGVTSRRGDPSVWGQWRHR